MFVQGDGKPLSVDEFKIRRLCWVSAYVEAMGCQISSSASRFAEMVKTCAVVKAQSTDALRKAAERAAKKSIETVAGADSESDDVASEAPKTPAVAVVLSELEARVISFMRANKWEMAAETIAQAAEMQL